MRDVLVIGAAGALGSMSRYGISVWAQRRYGELFPYGTLIVNAAGSLLLGFVLGMALAGKLPRVAGAGAGTGFLGAFTTFSTFSCETVLLVKTGKLGAAAGNVALNLALGLVAATIGFWIAARAAD
jgi:CrcB protein